jgi:hypothetical protein
VSKKSIKFKKREKKLEGVHEAVQNKEQTGGGAETPSTLRALFTNMIYYYNTLTSHRG